jgi:hypothetical protein
VFYSNTGFPAPRIGLERGDRFLAEADRLSKTFGILKCSDILCGIAYISRTGKHDTVL